MAKLRSRSLNIFINCKFLLILNSSTDNEASLVLPHLISTPPILSRDCFRSADFDKVISQPLLRKQNDTLQNFRRKKNKFGSTSNWLENTSNSVIRSTRSRRRCSLASQGRWLLPAINHVALNGWLGLANRLAYRIRGLNAIRPRIIRCKLI